jgi:hypothetical protein
MSGVAPLNDDVDDYAARHPVHIPFLNTMFNSEFLQMLTSLQSTRLQIMLFAGTIFQANLLRFLMRDVNAVCQSLPWYP